MKQKKPDEPRIPYVTYGYSMLFFIIGVLFFLYFWGLNAVAVKKPSPWLLLGPTACVAAGVVCRCLEIYNGYTVYLDGAGIHIQWRDGWRKGESMLIPRESLPLCRMYLGIHREDSTIYVFREEAAERYGELLFREKPTEQEYREYELSAFLDRVRRGKMTREKLLRQPLFLLTFDENGDRMQKKYWKFRRFWVPEAENEGERTQL